MRTNFFLATLMTAALASGCGDDGNTDEGSTTAQMTTTMTMPMTTTMTTTGDTPTTTMPGDDTTGGTADDTTGGASVVINECDSATATDMTGMTDVTITQEGLAYSPNCLKVTAGTSVKFVSAFASHPLVGGIVDGSKMPDAGSPITATSTGMEATFVIPAGNYGYYCDLHALSGMKGAIFAE
jgi:plastocyanin